MKRRPGMHARIVALVLTLMFTNLPCPADTQTPAPRDVHSYANHDKVRVEHVDLDLDVNFERKALEGTATLVVKRISPDADSLVLDTRDLTIRSVEASADGASFAPTEFSLGARDSNLGAPLTIRLPVKATKVRIAYATAPGASGLQWLEPAQTAGKKLPFLFSQSQAHHARSWVPVQDTPSVRVTYTARLRTPKTLFAVMSAENDPTTPRDGDYSFRMEQPIPAYLMAVAVGDIAFRSTGPRTGVYAEPGVVEAAAREFSDMEKMMHAAERLYGPYRWERYDVLVLPPSFPIGGMENPRLTFATPTIIAGDKSLMALVAHEMAHSWSGNLVTNATWSDLWLNEGFTVYVERRIVEEVYGRAWAEMEAALGRQGLEEEMATLEPRDQSLRVDFAGRDPDEVFSSVAYDKGYLFLRQLEEVFGRERFDAFLRGYFDHFAFRSLTTEDFLAYLKANLLDKDPAAAAKVPVDEWVYKPGLPASAPRPASDAFTKVEAHAKRWLDGAAPSRSLDTSRWSTQEWLHFLKFLPADLGTKRMAELDKAFRLTRSGNAEIAHVWLLMAIRNGYAPADARLRSYLVSIGRQKLIKPLYQELVKTPEGKRRAMEIYRQARPGYHPIAVITLDPIVGWK